MNQDLKQKTAHSFLWSSIDKFGFQVVAFLIGIITARLLSPSDFGLVGALAIFTSVAYVFVESGFSTSMMRREKNTDDDYTAILYFHIVIGIVLYAILFCCAGSIARFFSMPELKNLSRLIFLNIIFYSIGIVPTVILSRRLTFKPIAWANLISASISGVLTIVLALLDFGYWALALQQVSIAFLKNALLWIFCRWKPTRNPNFSVLKEVFSFSSLLLFVNFINMVVRYIYNVIIGRSYGKIDLGYYAQSYKYQQIPVNTISTTFNSVCTPVLSKLNAEPERQLAYFRKIIRIAAFILFPIMLGLFSISESFVRIILSDKWLPLLPYFRILLIAGLFYPLHVLYISLIVVRGNPKLMFYIEMTRNAIILASLIQCGNIENMLMRFLYANAIVYVIELFIMNGYAKYTILNQLRDVVPFAALSVLMLFFNFGISCFGLGYYLEPLSQIVASIVLYIGILYLFRAEVIRDGMDFLQKKI